MLELKVNGMSCGHCAAAVTRAVHLVDPGARVAVDRPAGRVSIDRAADPAKVQSAIEAEGYAVEQSTS